MMRSWRLVAFVLLIALTLPVHAVGNDDELKEFLYLKEDPADVFPIQEYKASSKDEKPNFLFNKDYPYPRLVEFYAHWCPHCLHFKPKYIEFAKKLKEVLDNMPGVTVETRAISCVPNQQLCASQKVHGYPTLLLYPAHSINGTKVPISSIHPKNILKQLGIKTDHYSQEKPVLQQEEHRDVLSLGNVNPHFSSRSKQEIYDDAHLSLDFALRHGIYTANGPLPTKSKQTLKDFFLILQNALPSSASMQLLIKNLLENFVSISKSDEQLQGLMENHSPPKKTWSPACLQHGTGYTCGLWTLFHIMSVGLVEWNALAVSEEAEMAPEQVGEVLRNYIEHFFQCDECRVHFLAEYDACEHDRCNRLINHKGGTLKDWRQFPLWLYEAHNAVNTRLRKERLAAREPEDTNMETEVLWPPLAKCPSCWLSEGRWDEEKVYHQLRLEYWPEDYSSEKLRNDLHGGKATPDLHPDISGRVDPPKAGDEALQWSLPALVLASTAGAAMASVWYRKRRFDRKGMHKKHESFEDMA